MVVLSGGEVFSNGIHLNVIEAADDPAAEAWRNINAIDDVCREIIECRQLVVAAVGGNAGAGGVMLALGADRVVLREGVVLNPHYQTMGLFGSEYWTYVLPRRIGHREAQELTGRGLPDRRVRSSQDRAGRRGARRRSRRVRARRDRGGVTRSPSRRGASLLAAKAAARRADEQRRPLLAYRVEELAEMSRDIFDDRNGFAARAMPSSTTNPPRSACDRSVGRLLPRVLARPQGGMTKDPSAAVGSTMVA